VVVQLHEVDSILRPAMTTGNEIVTYIYNDVLFVPIEALYNDSLSFVYKNEKSGLVKQEVITGASNEDEIIIEHGLNVGEEILLAEPENATKLAFVPLDPNIKTEILKKLEEDRKARQALIEGKKKKVKDEEISDGDSSGGNMIIFN
jgi:hypothetical protein